MGGAGALTRLTQEGRERLVRLPSHAAADGSAAFGPHDVAKDDATVFATVGLGGDDAFRDAFGPPKVLGWARSRFTRSGGLRVVADLLEYEATHDPAGDGVDSTLTGCCGWTTARW